MASHQLRTTIYICFMLQCVGLLQAAVHRGADSNACGEHEFKCADDGSCILKKWQCDGFADCFDSSDEQKCAGKRGLPISAGLKAAKGVRENTNLHDGSGNVYVDALLEEVNDAVLNAIPDNAQLTEFAASKLSEYDPDAEIECVLNGVETGFQRKNDSWIRIEYKDLIFTSEIATPPIDIKCNGKVYLGNILDSVKQPEGISYWKKMSANTIRPKFVFGLTTTGLVIDVKANMELELCFKPELEDLSVDGEVEPIINIEGFWGQMASIAGWLGREEIEDAIEGAKNSTIQAFQEKQENAPTEIKEMINNRKDIFCLDNSLDNLGDKLSAKLDELLKEYNLN